MFSYILFDLDGTISDPKVGITGSVQYALHALGINEPDVDRLEPFIGPPLRDSFQEYYHLNKEQTELAVQKYRERFLAKGIYENVLYPGMRELLKRLKASGCHLAVASSKLEVSVTEILRYFALEDFFEVTVGSEPDGTRSSKEDVVEEALHRFFPEGRIPYDDIVMIGDRKFDVIGGKKFGLHQIAVSYGYAPEGELEAAGAEYIADSVEELGSILFTGKK